MAFVRRWLCGAGWSIAWAERCSQSWAKLSQKRSRNASFVGRVRISDFSAGCFSSHEPGFVTRNLDGLHALGRARTVLRPQHSDRDGMSSSILLPSPCPTGCEPGRFALRPSRLFTPCLSGVSSEWRGEVNRFNGLPALDPWPRRNRSKPLKRLPPPRLPAPTPLKQGANGRAPGAEKSKMRTWRLSIAAVNTRGQGWV